MTTDLPYDDWLTIKNIFIANGFSEEEAEWAANNDLDPEGIKGIEIRSLLIRRRRDVAIIIRNTNWSHEETVEFLDQARRTNAISKGYDDEMNLFAGTT